MMFLNKREFRDFLDKHPWKVEFQYYTSHKKWLRENIGPKGLNDRCDILTPNWQWFEYNQNYYFSTEELLLMFKMARL